jgi:CDP-4-dehydro-6-deoxyglucose reductase, E3
MAYRVHILQTGAAFVAGADESLLDAAERAGVKLPHECTFGGCGTCRIKLESGAVRYDDFPMALTPEEAAEGYALACQARAESDLCISVPSSRQVFPEPRQLAATVHRIDAYTDDIIHLTLALPDGGLDYVPGQYMNVLLPDGETRSFSMASVPSDGLVDFHVRRIPGGRYTDQWLGQAQAGAALTIEAALGRVQLPRGRLAPAHHGGHGHRHCADQGHPGILAGQGGLPARDFVLGHAHAGGPVSAR